MNQNRRNFLKLILISTGVFLVGKFFASHFSFLNTGEKELNLGENFKAIEEGGKITFFNQKGEKIFTINEEGEMEIGD